MVGILNVFQNRLIRGSERLPYAPDKKYFYVEHPEEGWRVYMRACCFIHIRGEPFSPSKFVVVKTTGKSETSKSWEPPKGQTEGKDGLKNPKQSLLSILQENVRREVGEEAKLHKLYDLHHTSYVVQSVEHDYPPNTYFQYHIFQAFIDMSEFDKAKAKFTWYRNHPDVWSKLKKDKVEKDDINFYSESKTKMFGRWSPSIVREYLKTAKLRD